MGNTRFEVALHHTFISYPVNRLRRPVRRNATAKMRIAQSIWLSVLSIPLILAAPSGDSSVPVEFDFQELLAVLPAESLHAALHKHHDKFQDGVYEHDRIAVEKVHNEDPGTATKVLAEAALHLLKRQNGTEPAPTTTRTTTTAAPPPQTTTSRSSTVTPSEDSQTDVIVPIDVSTTNSQGQATTLRTSAVVATATVSVERPVTVTNEQGSTVTRTTNVPAAIVTENGRVTTSPVQTFRPSQVDPTRAVDVTTTNSRGRTVVLPSVTPGAVVTATDDEGGVFVTTYTPDGGVVESLVEVRTTLPNGEVSTITSLPLWLQTPLVQKHPALEAQDCRVAPAAHGSVEGVSLSKLPCCYAASLVVQCC